MPKQTAYNSLEVYTLAKKIVLASYELTQELPPEEKTNFCRYIRTAALCVHFNITRAANEKSKKKKKYIRATRKALDIIEAGCEIMLEVGLANKEQVQGLKNLSFSFYQLLNQPKVLSLYQ